MTRIGKILENGAQVPTAVDATPNLSSLLAATSSLVLNLVPDGTTSVNRPERSPSPTLVTADTETLLNMDVSAWRAQITEENARHLMAMPPMIGSGGQNGHSAHFNGRGLSGDTYYTSQPDADLLPPVTSKKRKLTEDHADWMMSPYNIASSGTPAADVDMYHLIGTSEATDDIFEPFVNLDPVSLGLGMLESQHVDEVMSTLCETSPAVPIPAQMPSRSTESVGSSAAKPSPYTPPTTNAKLSKSPTSLSLTSSTAHEGLSTSPPSPLSHIVLLARDTKYLTQKSREELQSCVDEVELLVQELQAVAFQQGGSPPAQSASPTSESPKLPNVEIKTLEPVSTIISEATSYGNRPKEATWPEEEGFQADEDLLVSLRVDPLPQLLSIMTRLNPALLSEDETKYILEKYLGTSVCWCSIGMPAALLLGPNAVKNPLLLNMSLAYGFRYLRQRRQAEIFLARAKRVLASVDELSLTTVRAVFMMGSYAGDQGKSSWGHAWTVLALYKALEMGLQHPPPPASTLPPSSPPPRLLNPLEYEFRTRIPWFLYISAVDYAFNYDVRMSSWMVHNCFVHNNLF
ncbi:hypothetical protein M427DRAFT_258681 [Gonapodya prolifera JEL478]|uniref:Transcription factor domain-containing protein n=1 Tax=Gonapodya prolifera (strain JEL478) TaxID=1344416 RepID=A0A138ZWY4_GONPJ|nr:hypothetical protein M427DRAFT_258681 [Gonapodya prolifera JEL478]|eukprot:KXS09020.1 hypothetical protein M427DRAFT_258681 [Gonapodya prolifera JEL478]